MKELSLDCHMMLQCYGINGNFLLFEVEQEGLLDFQRSVSD